LKGSLHDGDPRGNDVLGPVVFKLQYLPVSEEPELQPAASKFWTRTKSAMIRCETAIVALPPASNVGQTRLDDRIKRELTSE
jgi:hypothetical protein